MTTIQDQLNLEKDMMELGERKFRDSIGGENEFESAHIQKIVKNIIEPYSKFIEKQVKELKTENKRGVKAPLLTLMTKEIYVNPAKKRVKNDKEEYEYVDLDRTFRYSQVSFIVIRGIFMCLRENNRKRLTAAASLIGNQINSNILKDQKLSDGDCIRIGVTLINILIRNFQEWFMVEENSSGILTAPYDYFDRKSKNKEYLIIPSDRFERECAEMIEGIAEISTVIYPMIMKPESWTETGKNGGFYSEQLKRNIIKKKHINEASNINNDIAAAVNVVQSTPWVVSTDVLEVVEKLNSNKPSTLEKTFPLDVEDDPVRPYSEELLYGDMDAEQKREHQKWSRKIKKNNNLRQAKKSIDLSREASIKQAQMFKGYDKIYFPHDLDYRNRMYSICMTGLNTQGADIQKGLIKLANSRRVETENGVKWLKINMANLMGWDKLKLAERVDKVEEHEEMIRDVVKDPIKCQLWHDWDKPIQGLSAAIEYVKWLDDDGAYLNTHVQLDGLCNGVQHLAAITRDHNVAAHVGLIKTEERGDVYGLVSDEVILNIRGGGRMAEEWISSKLIDRSLTKTPVMTRSYGAKLYGIKEGIQDYILEKNMENHFRDSFKAGNWMGQCVWDAMGSSLRGPMAFMEWAQLCSGLLAEANLPMIWFNPIGGLCKQSPMVTKRTDIRVNIDGKRLRHIIQKPTNKISKPKSESSSSPNLTHGNDGSHLGLTVNICSKSRRHRIDDFAMVHDSFGAAPDDAEFLLLSAKKSWVSMYGNTFWPDKWHQQWSNQIRESGITELELPKFELYGNLKAEDVMDSDFFFA